MGREMDLNAWRLMVETVKAGSVNAACDHLNIEPSTASRVIKALERDLGFELFLPKYPTGYVDHHGAGGF